MLMCVRWKVIRDRNTEPTSTGSMSVCQNLELTRGRLIFLFDLRHCLLGSSLFSPESSLAYSSNASTSLTVMESEAFHIRSWRRLSHLCKPKNVQSIISMFAISFQTDDCPLASDCTLSQLHVWPQSPTIWLCQ